MSKEWLIFQIIRTIAFATIIALVWQLGDEWLKGAMLGTMFIGIKIDTERLLNE